MNKMLLPATLLSAALAGSCADRPTDARVQAANGRVREVALLQPPVPRLAIAAGAAETRVAAFAEGGASIWRSGDLAAWSLVTHTTSAGPGALAPAGSPVIGVLATDDAVRQVDEKGPGQDVLSLEVGETVSDLLITRTGIAMLLERRRNGGAAARVLFAAFRDGSVAAPGSLLAFPTASAQSAIAGCAGDPALLVVGTTRVAEVDRRLTRTTTLDTLRFDVSRGAWSAAARVIAAGDDSDFGRDVVIAPQSISARCDGKGVDVLVRGSSGWLLHGEAGGRWTPPRRVISYGPGYGQHGSSTAFCGERAVWIDNRLERGTTGASSVLGGFPWSDAYRGWGISSVFAAPAADLDRGGAGPLLVSPDTGIARAVAAADASDGGCVVAWAGARRVAKAGGNAADAAPRLFVTKLDSSR